MERKSLWAVVVVGLMLAIAPFAFGLPAKAAAGQKLMDDFRPLMQPANVDQSAAYYNDVFVPFGEVVPALSQDNIAKFSLYVQAFTAVGVEAPNLVPALAQALNMSPEQVLGFMAAQFPAMSNLLANLPTMQADFTGLVSLMERNAASFEQVPGGLTHYRPLLTAMQANVDNYRRADQLPNMNLFTWFFLVPGLLLMGLGGLGLLSGRKDARRSTAVPSARTLPVDRRPHALGHA